MHQVHSLVVDAALNESRKSGAIYESGAKYKLRFFRAMNFFLREALHRLAALSALLDLVIDHTRRLTAVMGFIDLEVGEEAQRLAL